jgi:hypothetical protein
MAQLSLSRALKVCQGKPWRLLRHFRQQLATSRSLVCAVKSGCLPFQLSHCWPFAWFFGCTSGRSRDRRAKLVDGFTMNASLLEQCSNPGLMATLNLSLALLQPPL